MTAEGLWTAVERRDRTADGLFVYGVRSTHVYCRPSCPSRRPARAGVDYFPTPAMAEAGGFRACKRCRPNGAVAGDPAIERIRRACAAVAASPDASWTTARIARAGATSVVQIQRGFRGVLGVSPREYVAACRRRRFLARLKEGHRVTDAIYEAGYGSPSRVYGAFVLPGMTPATYGRRGEGATLHWTTAPTSLGRVLVAATDRGLCFVEIGAEVDALVRELRREFPRATIDAKPSSRLGALVAAVRAIAEAKPVPANVPLDIRGTAFQWRVWRALTKIPVGETRAYSAVAASLGRPEATRAVARACATNPISLVVPCHRVVGRDGSVTGYRWGTNVKVSLLAKEAREAKPGKEDRSRTR
jgi:AraC family transcriptional regulator of adaptative response/methylated-DNA-[protein]-cysteine methyltransferase